MGLCYTFNAKSSSVNSTTSVRTTAENGGQGVLKLEFFVYDYLTVPYITDGVGIIAMVRSSFLFIK